MHHSRSVSQLKQQHRTWQRDYRAFVRMCAYYMHHHRYLVDSSSIIGGGTYTPTHTPSTHFMLNIQKHLLKRKSILRTNICWRNLVLIFQKFSKKKNFRMLYGVMGSCVTSFMMRHCSIMMDGSIQRPFRGSPTISLFLYNSELKPCSKWHHSAQTTANHGQLTYPTTTTTATKTIILPSTTTTTAAATAARSQRTTNTQNQNKLILTIQAPQRHQQQQTVSQAYANLNQNPTNLLRNNETITEVPETIAIRLKPSQRLLVLTSTIDTDQTKIVQLQNQRQIQIQRQTVQQTPKVQQQQQQTHQQRRTITLDQLQQIQQQRARLAAARSRSRIIRPGASVIRVPFLPGSPSTLPIVKQSSLIKKNSNLITPNYPLNILDRSIDNTQLNQAQDLKINYTPLVNTTNGDTVFCTTVLDTITDQNTKQNSEIIILNPDGTINTTNNYTKLCVPSPPPLKQQQQLLHSSVQYSQSQTQTQTQTPRTTLATMAGIQLTDADEHVSPSSMSGATPTATVEEINVPVFIDEYLQQPADTKTAATTNTTYSLTSSSSNSQNCRQSNSSSGNGSNANNNNSNTINGNGFEDEDFDFDMEMFADSSDVQVFEDNNTMINSIIYKNNNNNNNNNGIDNADINNDTFDDSCYSNTNNNSKYHHHHNNNNHPHMHTANVIKNEISDDLSQQYHILWDQLNVDDWLTSPELTANIESVPDLPDISENAVNFNDIIIKEMDDFLISSQNPMFSCATNNNNNNSNNFSNNMSNSQQMQLELIANSEPFVPKIEDHDDIFCDNNSIFVTAAPVATERPTATVPSIQPILSTTAHNDRSRMKQKRLKLLLPTAPVADSLSTPTVLGGIVDLQDEKMDIEISIYLGNSVANIEESLRDDTSRFTYTDEESPSTPRSCYSSFTTCTNENLSTTAYSPAPSNFSITQQTHCNNTSKKRRGRPAKSHSDQPDPAKLKNMPDSDRKRLLDRAKNNEASRVSRRKNKEREEQEKETERKLIERNLVLHTRRKDLVKLEKKLKRALMRGAIFAL